MLLHSWLAQHTRVSVNASAAANNANQPHRLWMPSLHEVARAQTVSLKSSEAPRLHHSTCYCTDLKTDKGQSNTLSVYLKIAIQKLCSQAIMLKRTLVPTFRMAGG